MRKPSPGVLPTLGRSTRQADVLAWLAEQAAGSPGPAAERLRWKRPAKPLGVRRGPVEALAKRGWVQIARPSPEDLPR